MRILRIEREPAGPGQESVWDYPRPPRVESSSRHVQVVFAGVTIADSHRAQRVIETASPPVFYFPPDDVRLDLCRPSRRRTVCEWKGVASYYDVVVGARTAGDAAWFYATPTPAFAAIANHVAFYPARMDACTIDGELAQAQPGDFYGGWITRDVVGPFKGAPGTGDW